MPNEPNFVSHAFLNTQGDTKLTALIALSYYKL